MNIKKLIKEEIVNVIRRLSEANPNDPMLKSLRTRVRGEEFPELKVWWEYEPEDIMTYVYWHQGKLPPTGKQFDKEWNNIVKQLHKRHPIPADVLPKLDMDDRTERAISVDAPTREGKDPYKPTFGKGDVVHDCPKHVQETISGKKGKVVAHSLNESGQVNFVDVDFGTGKVYRDIPTKKLKILEGQTHEHATKAEPKLNEALARGLKPLLMLGSKVKWTTMSEDALVDLSDKFEDIDDEQADDIASHLNMSIELRQDGYRGDATKKMKQFNKACADALKGKPIKSAFENVNEASIDRAGKPIKGFKPGDKWRNDFDYVGMLQWGVDANTETMDISELNAGYDSFTDVNYHTEAQDLGNAIDWLEDNPVTTSDHNKIEDFMSDFNSACAKTLEGITKGRK
jgi:hypothetical protein